MTQRLELHDLSIGYENPLHRDINLNVGAGQTVCVVGPSGCGKSTLLQTVIGAIAPRSGDILIDGKSVTDLPIHRRGIGIVFQQPTLFPHLSVFENVAYGLRRQGLASSDVTVRIHALLEWAGVSELSRRPISELSGGQAQRIALARALAPKPRVLLLDEPLSALDDELRVRLAADLRDMLAESDAACLYVTHRHDEVALLSATMLPFDQL